MNRYLLFLVLAVVAPITHAAPVLLGPSSYVETADSPFTGLDFGYFYLEDFEDGSAGIPLNTPGVVASGGAFQTGPSTDSVDADDGAIDGSGLSGNSFFGAGASGFTFTFSAGVLGSLPTHVGIVWTDGAIINEVTFEAFDSNNDSLGTIVAPGLGDNSFQGGTEEDRFFGVIDPLGISAIRIFNSAMSGGGSGIEADHLQYGRLAVVPVPAAVWLFGSALVGLGWIRRKQSV